jgi:hypothetical protein
MTLVDGVNDEKEFGRKLSWPNCHLPGGNEENHENPQ